MRNRIGQVKSWRFGARFATALLLSIVAGWCSGADRAAAPRPLSLKAALAAAIRDGAAPGAASACKARAPSACATAPGALRQSATAVSETIFANGFDNTGGECLTALDCPESAVECKAANCSEGLCGEVADPFHTDCSAGFCDGAGNCVGCLAAADCLVPECFDPHCNASTCGSTLTPAGIKCSAGVCNGGGQCVGCLLDLDCGPAPECSTAHCTGNACGTTFDTAGTACSIGICDGAGTCVQCMTAANCPATGSECKTATCADHVCGTANAAIGTSCNDGNGMCDGSGNCL